MTEEEILEKINDVLTGRAEELVLYTGGREAFTLYEREIGNYELRPMGRPQAKPWDDEIVLWSLQAEGFPYPIYFDEAKAR